MSYTPEVDSHQDDEYLSKHYNNVHNVNVVLFVLRVMYHLQTCACLVISMFMMASWNLQLLSVLTFVLSHLLHDANCCFKHESKYRYVGVSGLLFICKILIVCVCQANSERLVIIYMGTINLLLHSLFDGVVYLIAFNQKLSNELHHLIPFRVDTEYVVVDELL